MRPREGRALLIEYQRELARVSTRSLGKNEGMAVDGLDRLRSVVSRIVDDEGIYTAVRNSARNIQGDPVYLRGVPGMPISLEQAHAIQAKLEVLNLKISSTMEILSDVLGPVEECSLQIMLPPTFKTLSDLREVLKGVEACVDYPARGTMHEGPEVRAVEPGSVWLIATFASVQPLLMTLGCLTVFFAMLAGVMRLAQAVKVIEEFGKRSAIGEELIKQAIENAKDVEGRARLLELVQTYAPEMEPDLRNEWVNRVLSDSFERFRILLDSGMKILYSSRDVNQDFLKTLPAQFSLETLTSAASKPFPALPSGQAAGNSNG